MDLASRFVIPIVHTETLVIPILNRRVKSSDSPTRQEPRPSLRQSLAQRGML